MLTIHYGDMETLSIIRRFTSITSIRPNGFKMLLRKELLNPSIKAVWLDSAQ